MTLDNLKYALFLNNKKILEKLEQEKKNFHTHTNKEILDKLSVDEYGTLLFDGEKIKGSGSGGSSGGDVTKEYLDNILRNYVKSTDLTNNLITYETLKDYIKKDNPKIHEHSNKNLLDSLSIKNNKLYYNNNILLQYNISKEKNNEIIQKEDGLYVKSLTSISSQQDNAIKKADDGLYVKDVSDSVSKAVEEVSIMKEKVTELSELEKVFVEQNKQNEEALKGISELIDRINRTVVP